MVLRIAAYKHALESAKVKLRNNVPQTSSVVTAITRVDSQFLRASASSSVVYMWAHYMTAHVCRFVVANTTL